jgi:hypothetical protein
MNVRNDHNVNNGGYTFGAPPASGMFKNSIAKLSWIKLQGMLEALKKHPRGVESEINAIVEELSKGRKGNSRAWAVKQTQGQVKRVRLEVDVIPFLIH